MENRINLILILLPLLLMPQPSLLFASPIEFSDEFLASPSFDYPPSQPTTVGDWYVDGDSGSDDNAGTTEDAPFKSIHRALNAVQDGQTILVRAGTYTLTKQLRLRSRWTEGVRLWGYGSERPTIDCSNLTNEGGVGTARCLYLASTDRWHIRGFEVINSYVEMPVVVTKSSHNILEDLWIHHSYKHGVYLWKGGHNAIVDVVVWHMGDGVSQNTNVGDGFASNSNNNIFVRCVAIDAPDDGFDVFFGRYNEVHDSVVIGSGHYFNGNRAGDGNGYKGGGNSDRHGAEMLSGDNTFAGCLSVGTRKHGFNHNFSTHGNITFRNCTAVNSGGFGFVIGTYEGHRWYSEISEPNTAINNISVLNDDTHFEGDKIIHHHNTWNLDITDPLFVDPDQGNYFLDPASPGAGAGEGGVTLGASRAALELYRRWRDTH